MFSKNIAQGRQPLEKQEKLNALYESTKRAKGSLVVYEQSNSIIFGEGSANATLMIIGEAPGKQEDLASRPFVGRSGKLLREILLENTASLKKIFITNILKTRPPNNRTPTKKEINQSHPLLKAQIEIIHPKVICTLGSCAFEGVSKRKIKITREHGKPTYFHNKIILIPAFHPAYILRNPKQRDALSRDLQTALQMANIQTVTTKILPGG